MKENQIITIGRQLGSGGSELGKRLSKELGIPFYDKELLAEAAKKSGYSPAIFEQHDEKPTNSFLYSLAMGINNMGQYQKPLLLELYLAQFDTIKKLANDGPGIFIGRCADYVLEEHPNVLNIFVCADMKDRKEAVADKYGISLKEAEERCKRCDKDRASYYNYYSNEKWGDAKHYDLCINTSKIGLEKATKLILTCIN